MDIMTYYKKIEIRDQKINFLSAPVNITDEGVYYTLFIYDKVKDDRRLEEKANKLIGNTTPHLVITGTIKYKNTDGYLNAEYHAYLTFHPVMIIFNLILLIFWVQKMKKFQDHLINLHYYVLAVISLSFLQCFFSSLVFYNHNHTGTYSGFLMGLSMLVDVLRNTFARVVFLLVGIGYGILITTMGKYETKVLTLAFSYMISLSAYLGILFINNYSPVSKAMIFIVSFPLAILNSLFYFWIWATMRRTMNYLEKNEQTYKLNIIS